MPQEQIVVRGAREHNLVARRDEPVSLVSELMRSRRERMDWWTEALASLGGVRHAIAGAVAANTYMPPRQTADIDAAVYLPDPARRRGGAPPGGLDAPLGGELVRSFA